MTKGRTGRRANPIVELWSAGTVPACNGLYRADGTAWAVETDGPQLSQLVFGPPLDLAALLANDPEAVTVIDRFAEAELVDGSGYVCCGDGALGSDGFFARLDQGRSLVWVVSLTDSNPFGRIMVDGSAVRFVNNLGNCVVVDLMQQEYALSAEGE
ncbi:hypothetical protein [Catellatospora methionotrophica]|uniref:hypothetical protein n=1 Tax=Catellatospora methionotrophica TaxID=121620 RepID=UPI0033EC39FA